MNLFRFWHGTAKGIKKWMVEPPDTIYGLVGIGAYARMASRGVLSSSLHPACFQVWSPGMQRVGKVGLKVSLK